MWLSHLPRPVTRSRPLYQGVFLDGPEDIRTTMLPSVLSMSLLMRELAPRLAAASDGDPQTSTDEQPKS